MEVRTGHSDIKVAAADMKPPTDASDTFSTSCKLKPKASCGAVLGGHNAQLRGLRGASAEHGWTNISPQSNVSQPEQQNDGKLNLILLKKVFLDCGWSVSV